MFYFFKKISESKNKIFAMLMMPMQIPMTMLMPRCRCLDFQMVLKKAVLKKFGLIFRCKKMKDAKAWFPPGDTFMEIAIKTIATFIPRR